MSSAYTTGHDAEMDRYQLSRDRQAQAEAPQLIEFSFVRSNETVGQASMAVQEPYPTAAEPYTSNVRSEFEWCRPKDGQSYENIFSEEVRMRSSEMLQSDDMQRLLRTFGVDVDQETDSYGHVGGSFYSCNDTYDARNGEGFGLEKGKNSGKAVVGWLKLKAALRWGIFERKRAAERRAQLVELD